MSDPDATLARLLGEAHANELALTSVLRSHIVMTHRGSYRSALEQHLEQTREHARLVKERLGELDGARGGLGAVYSAAHTVLKQGMVLAKAPIDMIRGRTDVKEKMLRNAIDEAMTEGMEIGCYDAIEALARSLGDNETAELAASIRLEEEQMFEALRKEIPALAEAVAESARGPQPWPGYDTMKAQDIVARLGREPAEVASAVRAYESRFRKRATVLKATERAEARS